MKRKAFTLIELLVVIAIIALLMAMIMPALSKAKNSAKRVVCQAHQKSLAQAYVAYGTENDSFFAPMAYGHPYFATNRTGFGGWREGRHYLEPYTTPEIFYCPAMGDGLHVQKPDDYWIDPVSGGEMVGWSLNPIGQVGNYYVVTAYNFFAGTKGPFGRLKYLSNASRGSLDAQKGNAQDMPDRFSQLKNTGMFPLLADMTLCDGRFNLDTLAGEPWSAYREAGSRTNNKALNHIMRGGQVIGINSAYADGHVEWRKDEEILPRVWQPDFNKLFWY